MKRISYLILISVLISSSSPILVQQRNLVGDTFDQFTNDDKDSSSTRSVLLRIADSIIAQTTYSFVDEKSGSRFTSPEQASAGSKLQPESRYTDWRYWNGVLNIAMMTLGNVFNKPQYASFARSNIAFAFDHYQYFERNYDGSSKWEYPFAEQFTMEELDDCGAMGASVLEVFTKDPQRRYREYIDRAAHFILTGQHRWADGTLIRSFPPPWTVWADDLYMSVSFLSRMGALTRDSTYFDDAALQVVKFHKHLFDPGKGLMVHCWYAETGRPGVAFWGRANGWALLAQVDLLDRIPKDHPRREELLQLLRRHITGIARYQGAEGLWHQLLDKTDSYLETSCSAMFTYAVARAVNEGYIEPRYATIAERGWEGVLSRIRSDGQVEGVCAGTGVSDDLVSYYHRPAPLNDIHGLGAVLLAGSEVLQLHHQ